MSFLGLDRRDSSIVAVAAIALVVACYVLLSATPWLSVVVRTVLLCFGALALLTAARSVDPPLQWLLDGLAVVAYLAAAYLALAGRDVGRLPDLFVIVVVPVLLAGAAVYLLDRSGVAVERRHVAAAFVCLLLVSVPLVGADVAGPDVTYETTLANDSILANDSVLEQFTAWNGSPAEQSHLVLSDWPVAWIVADNEFALPQTLDPPIYEACVAGPGTDVVENVTLLDSADNPLDGKYIDGGKDRVFGIWAEVTVRDDLNEDLELTIERGADCSAEREEPTLLVHQTGGSSTDYSPTVDPLS